LAAEGASQLFRKKYNSDTILGVVGQLQAEVVKFRLLNEYGADAVFSPMNYQFSRWYTSKNKKALDTFESQYAGHIVYDIRELPLILFQSEWEKDYIAGKNPEIEFFSSLVNVS